MTVKLHLTNTYECGRNSTEDVEVRDPAPGEPLVDWWENVVAQHTGDGHPCGASEDALYEATVTEVDDPELRLGDTYTWQG